MTYGFILMTIGTVLVLSGVKHISIAKVLKGELGEGEGKEAGVAPGAAFASFLTSEGGSDGATGTVPSGGGGKPAAGMSTFDGQTVCTWIAQELQWARQHGWKGSLISGFRNKAEQAQACSETSGPCATPGQSNHQGKRYPKCAADVTDPAGLDRVLSHKVGRRLHWTGKSIGDEPHFSSGLNGV